MTYTEGDPYAEGEDIYSDEWSGHYDDPAEGADDPDLATRNSVIAYAYGEVGNGIDTHNPGPEDETGRATRPGWEKLKAIFDEAAPGIWPDDVIKYHGDGLPSWCGIFALYCLRLGGAGVGTWSMGSGISAVSGMKQVWKPKPGDVGYFESHQHHCIIYAVDGDTISTVDGNWGGTVAWNTRSRGEFAAFYSAFG